MKNQRALQLIVEKAWSAETISSLGSGYLYHLAYPVEMIQPELLSDLRLGNIPKGSDIEVYFHRRHTLHLIAMGELENINDFGTFIRIDFRILRTTPSLKRTETASVNGWHLRYS